MPGRSEFDGRGAGGLRTRYTPQSRLGQGLISVAPWVNVVLLLIMFALLDRKFVLQPGFRIELPAGPFEDGLSSALGAVVLSVPGAEPGAREDVVLLF